MTVTYENVTPSLIPNTTMQKRFYDGVHKQYLITPNEGYVLHDNTYDEEIIDEVTLVPTGEIKLGFRTTTATCGYNYDFAVNPRQFYAVLRTEVPENSEIYNVPDNTEIA